MKEVKKIAEGKNFSAVDFGKLNELGDYVLSMGEIKIPGKVFGAQALGTKGALFRFTLPARREVSITRIKPTKNSISSSAAKENIRLTARTFLCRKAVWYVSHLKASAPFTTTARSRWWCSACSTVRRLSLRTMPPMALS